MGCDLRPIQVFGLPDSQLSSPLDQVLAISSLPNREKCTRVCLLRKLFTMVSNIDPEPQVKNNSITQYIRTRQN